MGPYPRKGERITHAPELANRMISFRYSNRKYVYNVPLIENSTQSENVDDADDNAAPSRSKPETAVTKSPARTNDKSNSLIPEPMFPGPVLAIFMLECGHLVCILSCTFVSILYTFLLCRSSSPWPWTFQKILQMSVFRAPLVGRTKRIL